MNILSNDIWWIRIAYVKSLRFLIMKSDTSISLILLRLNSLISLVPFHAIEPTVVWVLQHFLIKIFSVLINHIHSRICHLVLFVLFLTYNSCLSFKLMFDLWQAAPQIDTNATYTGLISLLSLHFFADTSLLCWDFILGVCQYILGGAVIIFLFIVVDMFLFCILLFCFHLFQTVGDLHLLSGVRDVWFGRSTGFYRLIFGQLRVSNDRWFLLLSQIWK